MRRRAERAGGIVKIARFGLRQRDQFFDGFCRDRRMHHQYQRRGGDVNHRRELVHAIGHLRAHVGHQPQAAAVEHQRVAVGLRLGGDVADDHAAGAVVDHDLLAEAFGEAMRYEARGEIAAAADFGGEQADGFGGVGLCCRSGLRVGMRTSPYDQRRQQQHTHTVVAAQAGTHALRPVARCCGFPPARERQG